MKSSFRPFFLLLTFFLVLETSAQQDPILPQGIGPFESLNGGDIDAVNLGTGNLYVHIPLAAYPQRGGALSLSFSLQSNNKSYYFQCSGAGNGCSGGWWKGGTDSSVQVVDDQWPKVKTQITGTCKNLDRKWNYTLQTADGYQQFLGWATGCTSPQIKTFISPNGTGFSYTNSAGSTGYLLMDRSGIRYTHPDTTTWNREDPNGNLITYYSGSGVITSGNYTDTIGRVIQAPSAAPTTTDYTGCNGPRPISSAQIWTVPGPAGTSRTFKLCYVSIAVQTNFAACGGTEVSYTGSFLQSVVLPNGSTWGSVPIPVEK